MDWQTVIQFSGLVKGLPEDEPIFVRKGVKVYNSTVNNILKKHCNNVNVPVISIHGLRHTNTTNSHTLRPRQKQLLLPANITKRIACLCKLYALMLLYTLYN